MAVVDAVFTDNVSDAIEFSGAAKIVCSGMTEGQYILVQEEGPSGVYQNVNNKEGSLMIWFGQSSDVFYLLGSHKIVRSADNIDVGYVLS